MNKEEFSKVDATLLIAIASGLGYGVAYIYELNYLGYYYLPDIYIDLDISKIVKPILLIVSMISLILLTESFYEFKYMNYFKLIVKKFNPYILISIIFIALLLVAGYIGNYSASGKEKYQVISQEGALYVAVYHYNDSLIIAPVDVKEGIMSPNYQLIEINSIKDTEIIRFEEGLKVKRIKNNTEVIK
jgi:hypothetical protein